MHHLPSPSRLRRFASFVSCAAPLAAALFLMHCSAASSDGAGSASSAQSGSLCSTYCAELTACDTSQDVDTCNATCDDALGHTLGRLRDDVESSISSCVDGLDCKTLLGGDAISGCVDEAKASVAPSATDKKACQALSKAIDTCGADPLSVASCLDATKIYSDDTMNKVIACASKSCDQLADCVETALGTTSNGADAGVGEGGARDAGTRDAGDGGRDAGHGEGGTSASNGGSSGGACPGSAPSYADLENSGGWKAPGPRAPGSCSAADLQRLQSNLNGPQTFTDLEAGLSASCSSCVFSHESDATWGSIVFDASGTSGFVNFGACYAAQSGSTACGKAVQYDEFCVNVTCSACADADYQGCTTSSTTTSSCDLRFADGIQTSCPQDSYQASLLDTTCGNFMNGVKYLCGS